MTIDWKRPIETTDGRPARLVCGDLAGPTPYCVAVTTSGGELPTSVNSDGHRDFGQPFIRNKRTKREGWLNVYPDARVSPAIFSSRDAADRCASVGRVDCRPFTWEE